MHIMRLGHLPFAEFEFIQRKNSLHDLTVVTAPGGHGRIKPTCGVRLTRHD